MVRKADLGSWQILPVEESIQRDGWFARAVATGTLNSPQDLEDEFNPEEERVDDGFIMRDRSSSSVSSSVEGSQGGEGDTSINLSRLHHTLRVLSHVIMAEYGLPAGTLRQIKLLTSLSKGKASRRALRNFHSLRRHNQDVSPRRNMSKSRSAKSRDSSRDKTPEANPQPEPPPQRHQRPLTHSSILKKNASRPPTQLQCLRRDYHVFHRLLIDAHSAFEFPPPTPPPNCVRFQKQTDPCNTSPRRSQVRYNRELLSHKLPATLLRCLLAHKDLIGVLLDEGEHSHSFLLQSEY